ncbi:MAG: hypothetical protein IKZ06_01590 [Oscillospiraceae bacterium]|nr:hypothetical protein [Oscillospiraceae bacterium]
MADQRYFYLAFLSTPYGTGKFIRKMTGFEYNHMGFSFSPEFKYFYSFARRYEKMAFYAGFVKESILRYDHNGEIAKLMICALPVTEEQFFGAKKRIEYLEEHSEEYLYNLISAGAFLSKKRVEIEKSRTCIEFVLDMLREFTDFEPVKEKEFFTIRELFEIFEPFKIYEGGAEKFLSVESWEGDHFPEEKTRAFLFKKALETIAELVQRFLNRRERS